MNAEFQRSALLYTSVGFAYARTVDTSANKELDYQYIDVNDPYARMFGLQKEQMKGKFASLLHTDGSNQQAHWIALVAAVGQGGISHHFLHTFSHEQRWYNLSAHSPEQGFILLQIEDVTRETYKFRLYEKMFNLAPTCLCIIDTLGYLRMVNDEWSACLGYSRSHLVGRNIADFIHPQDAEATEQAMEALKAEQVITHFVNRYRHLDGSYRSFDWRAQMSNGFIYGAACDITENQRTERKKQRELDLVNLLIDQSLTGIAVYMFDAPVPKNTVEGLTETELDNLLKRQKIVRSNDAFLQQYALDRSDLASLSSYDFLQPDASNNRDFWQKLLNEGKKSFELAQQKSNGTLFWVRSNYSCLYNSRQEVVGTFCMQVDISAKKSAEMSLAESERMYRLIAENASDVIWLFNVTRNAYSYISPSIERIGGYNPAQMLEQPLDFLIHPDDLEALRESVQKAAKVFEQTKKQKNAHVFENRSLTQTNNVVWTESSVSFRFTEEGEIEAIGVTRDITAKKESEEKILQLSYRDQLTGSYNRRYWEMQQMSLVQDEASYPISLIMCDVNGLKLTNDVFGHHAGDVLLQTCANLLQQEVGPHGFLARIGGDEFVLLLAKTSLEEAQQIVERLQERVRQRGQKTPSLSISFGVASSQEKTSSLEGVFKAAEDEMYHHKLVESGTHKHELIQILVKSLYEKGPREKRHSEVVSLLAYHMGKELGIEQQELEELRLAALLHDIGKIGIDNEVLNRKGILTGYEWNQMHRHPEIGYQILRSVPSMGRLSEWVLFHHEQPDGKGYPQHLLQQEIPLPASIIAVANAYESMTSPLSGKEAKSHQQAAQELLKYRGTQFSSEAVDSLLKIPVEKLLKEYEQRKEYDGA